MKRHSRHNRRSIRLKGHDYTQPGMYFITVCAYDFTNVFGIVRDGVVVLNEWGKIVERCWYEIPKHFRHVQLDEFVIMPNHIHGILMIVDDIRRGNACVAPTGDTTVDATTGACVAPTGDTTVDGKTDACVAPTGDTTVDAKTDGCVAPTGDTTVDAKTDGCVGATGDIVENARNTTARPIPGSIGVIVGSFKSAASKHINRHRHMPGAPVWQRNYYEHIIRHYAALIRIRLYVRNNPLHWRDGRETH